MSDEDLNNLKDWRDSAKAISAAMKGQRFRRATAIRNHAKFIFGRTDLKVRVEESRRIFKREMKREREKGGDR